MADHKYPYQVCIKYCFEVKQFKDRIGVNLRGYKTHIRRYGKQHHWNVLTNAEQDSFIPFARVSIGLQVKGLKTTHTQQFLTASFPTALCASYTF